MTTMNQESRKAGRETNRQAGGSSVPDSSTLDMVRIGVSAALQCGSIADARAQIGALLGADAHKFQPRDAGKFGTHTERTKRLAKDHKDLGRFLANARERLLPAQADAMTPLRKALEEALQKDDAQLPEALRALWANRAQIFKQMNADEATAKAWEDILSAALANGFDQ